jgi:hypothetical protein
VFPNSGIRKMAFSMLPLSFRAGINTVVEYFFAASSSFTGTMGNANV